VIDVDEDDVLIIDGLTKRFRLPGWRVAWIIGPKEFIKAFVLHPPTASPDGKLEANLPPTALAPAVPTSMVVPTSLSKRLPSPCLSLS